MFEAFKEGLSRKAKAVLVVVILCILVGGGFGVYKLWDFKENNPNFCLGCHLMKEPFEKWSVSKHNKVNCHECHHLTLLEQNLLLVNLILHGTKEMPPRHGKIIVPAMYCTKCHVDTNEKFPDAVKINNSPFHAKHFFMVKLECTKCHSYKPHEFAADARLCVNCHKDHQDVHGMASLSCLSCHTDSTENFMPNRAICLSCHGDKGQRQGIVKLGCPPTMKQCPPSPQDVASAQRYAKYTFPENGAMQFECYKCHRPHGKIMPVADADCVPCHKNVKAMGKHQAHLDMGMKCLDCHKPHLWKVTAAQGKSAQCTKCHGPVDPGKFLL